MVSSAAHCNDTIRALEVLPRRESGLEISVQPGHATEHGWVGAIGHVHAIQEQHVEVHVQVQRRAEALYLCHRAATGEASTFVRNSGS